MKNGLNKGVLPILPSYVSIPHVWPTTWVIINHAIGLQLPTRTLFWAKANKKFNPYLPNPVNFILKVSIRPRKNPVLWAQPTQIFRFGISFFNFSKIL